MNRLPRFIAGQWHRPTLAGQIVLRPLSWLFAGLAAARRWCYRLGLARARRLPVPVIVVGNLTVGGSGKTPLVAHLVTEFARAGLAPGIVSRGHGRHEHAPRRLTAASTVRDSGDEPIWLAQYTGRPVAVGRDRSRAAELLLPDCDVIVADDGLQHYALARDIEIAVVDGDSGLGNGRLLPAGPLREPARRLRTVDHVAVRDGEWPGAWRYRIVTGHTRNLVDGSSCPPDAWKGITVHAVAGIGVPGRFFGQLEDLGIDVIRHGFADHHAFARDELDFDDDLPVLMTEKDAVKCRPFADARMWVVTTVIEDLDGMAAALCRQLETMGNAHGPTIA